MKSRRGHHGTALTEWKVAKRKAKVAKKRAAVNNLPPEVDGERPDRYRSNLVRRSMLNAAADLFAERGFGGTNLRDVADVLGMSRPGLYYHFPSKEKILEALIEEVTLSFAAQLETMTIKKDQDPEEALRNVVSISALWVLENPVLFRVLDRSEAEIPEELKDKHDASKRVILEHFTNIIERGIAIGKFRPVDPHVASLTIAGMCNWTSWWFKPEGRLHRNEIAASIAQMAVRSLLRPDAHRSRSDRVRDVLQILKEDVAHLDHLIKD
jgi:AcrR family transcriptional regulator